MRVAKLVLTNFQCFGPEPTTVVLDDVTALIGANGVGKTAVLEALKRLFGVSAADREVRSADFHTADAGDDVKHKVLQIEAELVFPELDANNDLEEEEDAEDSDEEEEEEEDDDDEDEEGEEEEEVQSPLGPEASVAAFFRTLLVDDDQSPPYCRLRLTAEWSAGLLPEGDIETKLQWILVPHDEDETENDLAPVRSAERNQIQLHYVPAIREPLRHLRTGSGAILGRLLQAVVWGEEAASQIEEAIGGLQQSFAEEDGIKAINNYLNAAWNVVHKGTGQRRVALRPVGGSLIDLYRNVEAVFSPAPTDTAVPLDRLSEGQRSLFYLALVAANHKLLGAIASGGDDSEDFDTDYLRHPCLTLFAIEEPENHVAPHYLSTIVDLVQSLSDGFNGQAILTSHSPAIIRRISPEAIRHLRLDDTSHCTILRSVEIPTEDDDAAKYVREAVRAYPELYFSRLVILGEGDSEELVLPATAEALGTHIDPSFVSMVPLGGRHVNHFWRLLDNLSIPFITLLDLDAERHGGGWGRVHYAISQLLELGADRNQLLAVGDDEVLSDGEFSGMPSWKLEKPQHVKNLAGWAESLEEFDVFFSAPLDLDMMMLEAFPKAYTTLDDDDRGPIGIDAKGQVTNQSIDKATRAVLKGSGGNGATYSQEQKKLFVWYRYLFLGRGKPATHLRALNALEEGELASHCPAVLKRLIDAVQDKLKQPNEAADIDEA